MVVCVFFHQTHERIVRSTPPPFFGIKNAESFWRVSVTPPFYSLVFTIKLLHRQPTLLLSISSLTPLIKALSLLVPLPGPTAKKVVCLHPPNIRKDSLADAATFFWIKTKFQIVLADVVRFPFVYILVFNMNVIPPTNIIVNFSSILPSIKAFSVLVHLLGPVAKKNLYMLLPNAWKDSLADAAAFFEIKKNA